jgi:hypothetical protein
MELDIFALLSQERAAGSKKYHFEFVNFDTGIDRRVAGCEDNLFRQPIRIQ